MRAEHDSRHPAFRFPVGAAEAGGCVRLSVLVTGAERASGELRLWQEGVGETRLLLKEEREDESIWLSSFLTLPEKGTILWYRFELQIDGKKVFCGQDEDELGGIGIVSERELPSFQITVYEKGADTPAWLKKGIMYHMFPDRFRRAGNAPLPEKRGAVLHMAWSDTPQYYRDADGSVLAYDFFGGNLAGIREKLPYLASLGVTILYLNPVFEAESSHRYDTGDYTKIDPLLGTNEEFRMLCMDAKELGIRIVLDGVFSHTGADSVYFNRYGTYDSVGAFQSKESPYYEWYDFQEYPEKYASWWGVEVLPAVKETTPSYLDFIVRGKDSVLHRWLDVGISGWRLDVLDELPEAFSEAFYAELKRRDPDAALIGEVWEDASHKVSYGKLRTYLCGRETDSVMNYPLRRIMIDFLLGKKDGARAAKEIASLHENYPSHHFYAMMNLLGSHDTERILSVLGEMPDTSRMTQRARGAFRLSEEQKKRALSRVRLALLWQMTFPGMPSVYYGDEIAMEGGKDPYNRAPYDWEHGDEELREAVMRAVKLRRENDALMTGAFFPLFADGDIYSYARIVRDGRDVFGCAAKQGIFITVLNRSASEMRRVVLGVGDFAAADGAFVPVLTAGVCEEKEIPVRGKTISVTLEPLSGAVLEYRVPTQRYARAAGILLHPTSLPSPHGIGDIGAGARRFVDWLAEAGQSIWQILPLVPVGWGGSPYSSPSAFAGNFLLISPEDLARDGLLTRDEIRADFAADTPVDFEKAAAHKRTLLRLAWARFRGKSPANYVEFCRKNAAWLDDYALFTALHEEQKKPWTEWDAPLRRREPSALRDAADRLFEACAFVRFVQYVFACQWQTLHAYAAEKRIFLFGDLPLFVAQDSADVWSHPQLFALDGEGRAKKVAGVPPDYFSADGQLWGNPQYDWQRMAEDGYAWWAERIARLASLVDIVRIDHFRGLASYWEIEAGAKTAREGRWVKGPGRDFFAAIRKKTGTIKIVAEDLGEESPDVEALRRGEGFPGMRVLEFSLTESDMPRAGSCEEENTVIYTGTHDNNTAAGWYEHDLDARARSLAAAYLGLSADASPRDAAAALVRAAYMSRARLAVVPMQDVLGLGEEARMNLPGEAKGNWRWRMKEGALSKENAAYLRHMAEAAKRIRGV